MSEKVCETTLHHNKICSLSHDHRKKICFLGDLLIIQDSKYLSKYSKCDHLFVYSVANSANCRRKMFIQLYTSNLLSFARLYLNMFQKK